MKTTLTLIVGTLVLIGLTTGCSSLQQQKVAPAPQAKQLLDGGKVAVSYPVKENLKVEVAFQNQRTYDAVQLGLFLLAQTEEGGVVVGIDEPAFFPRYFTLVNTNIEEGLLYISESEGLRFAKVAYLQYQGTVSAAQPLPDLKEQRTLSNIMPDTEDSITVK